MFQRPPAPCLHPSTALTAPSTCQGSQVPGTAMGPTQSPHTVAKGSISCLLLGWSWGCSQPSTGSMPLTTWAFFGKVWLLVFLPFQWLPKHSQCPGTGPAQTGAAKGPPLRYRDGCSEDLCPGTRPPPEPFWGSLGVWSPDRQGGEESRTRCMHPMTHVQLQGPGTVTFHLCSRGETGRIKRDAFGHEQKPRVWEGWTCHIQRHTGTRDTVTPPTPTPGVPGTGNESHHPSRGHQGG